MSMIARFVAIAPEQLAAIRQQPDSVTSVFAIDASDAAPPPGIPSLAQERMRLRAPQLVAEMLHRMPPDVRERMRRRLGLNERMLPPAGSRNPLLLQLAQREAARQRTPPPPGAAGHGVSLDKAWHGVHYLLCGKREPAQEPLAQAVFGGSEIGDDRGYGPARCLAPGAVGAIAAALRKRGLETAMRARFDAAEMTRLGIYPGTWEADDRAWLIERFRALRDFYAAAGRSEQAVVTVIE